MEELNKFYINNKELCLAFKSWIARNAKQFTLVDGLNAIYDYCNGNNKMMKDVLTQFKDTMKRKIMGRTQVYGGLDASIIDIIPDENGKLKVVGYTADRQVPLKGQHYLEDPIKTKSGAINKTVRRSKETLDQVGKRLREIFPGRNVEYLKNVEMAVYDFAKQKKISQMKVVNGIANGKYKVTFDKQIRQLIVVAESRNRIIYINEDAAIGLREAIKMTEYKFYSNVKYFLHDLLVDPVNADVPMLLKMHGYDRNSMLKLLIDNNIVTKKQKIVDKGKDGEPITPVMRVKYSIPKKNFDNKLKRLYIREYEKNVINEECACGGDCGGVISSGDGGDGNNGNSPSGSTTTFTAGDYSVIQPFGIVSQVGYNDHKNKKKKKELDETSTADVGDYQYTVPFPGDEETLSRPKGGICVTVDK